MRATSILVLAIVCVTAGMVAGYELALGKENQHLERNKLLVRLSHEGVWSQRDNAAAVRVASEIYAPDFVLHDSTGDSTGLEQFVQGLKENRADFPDWTEKVESLVAEGDWVAARFTSTGT